MKQFYVLMNSEGELLSDLQFVNEQAAIDWAKDNLNKGTVCYLVLEKTFKV